MKRIVMLIAAMLLCLPAAAQQASDAIVERLMVVTRAQTLVGQIVGSMDKVMDAASKSAITEPLPPEKQAKLDASLAKVKEAVRAELSWDRLKPRYVRLYKETFTDEEIQGLITFYESPAGQALLAKMPVLMQKSIAMTQEQMNAMIPKIKAAVDEAVVQAKTPS